MRTIWKFPLKVDDKFSIRMPSGAQILSTQTQQGKPCMWVLIPDTDAPSVTRSFRVYGTGHTVMENSSQLEFIDTFQLMGGDLVFHLFEMK